MNALNQMTLANLEATVRDNPQIPHITACACTTCHSPQNSDQGNDSSQINGPLEDSFFTNDPITALTRNDDEGNPVKWDESVITYSFYSDDLGGAYYSRETNVKEVSDPIKANVRQIINQYVAPYIGVNFQEVDDTGNSPDKMGQLRYMSSNGPDYAYASYPSDYWREGGDVHLSPNYHLDSNSSFESGEGSHGYMALIHETLHALGLKHPGNYNVTEGLFLPGHLDNSTNTVMTYNFEGSSAATMMPYDIEALQFLYGRGNLNADDTTYTFTSVHSFSDGTQEWGNADTTMKLALWDADGTDTLDFSGLETDENGYRFDLNRGGVLTDKDTYDNPTEYTDQSGNGFFEAWDHGTAVTLIDDRDVLENVVGSSSDDDIIGNWANNHLQGRNGDDLIQGGEGDDLLNGGEGSDILEGGTGYDVFYGEAGDDQLNGGDDNDILNGGIGRDTLYGEAGDDLLNGGTGNDILKGGVGHDILVGGSQDDVLIGSRGKDWFDGGQGSDQYTGGQGRDIFELQVGAGRDVITDFEKGDRIELSNNLGFSDLDIVQRGKNVLIQDDQGDLLAIAKGTNFDQFTAKQFV